MCPRSKHARELPQHKLLTINAMPEMKESGEPTQSVPKAHKGVRDLNVKDQLPDCEIEIKDFRKLYDIATLSKGSSVVDIGCGFGTLREVVENAGGKWVGVEPFEGGKHTVVGDAENLPFDDNLFDVAIMHAVLEHVPNVAKAFTEVSRVLKPGGVYIGYVSFMESFHEISYTHMSFKSIEYFANENNMTLEKIASEGGFGIAHNMGVLLHPIPSRLFQWFINFSLRLLIRIKTTVAYFALRWGRRKLDKKEATQSANDYYKLEHLRQATGFRFLIRKNQPPKA